MPAAAGFIISGGTVALRARKPDSSLMKTIQTDILVCGGGCAGIAAALAASRNGAKTLLIERAGFSGGIITTVGLPYFDGLIDKPSGRLVVKGIAAMKTKPTTLTRREALLNALKGTVAAAVAAPGIVQAAPSAPSPPPKTEFVPENDYPFFGYEPDTVA